MGREGRPDPKQYSPGEIADLEASRAASDAATERNREELKKNYTDEFVEELIQTRARTEMERDFRKREVDRKREKPENATKALNAIDSLWNDIDKALRYRPEHKDQSIIDKNWADDMLKILTELEEQIKFEGSFPSRMFDDIRKAGQKRDGPKPWIEGKWKRKVDALVRDLLRGSVERYTETPQEEKQRRAAGDRARSEYKAGEIREKVAEM